jgi:hypothetical protein
MFYEMKEPFYAPITNHTRSKLSKCLTPISTHLLGNITLGKMGSSLNFVFDKLYLVKSEFVYLFSLFFGFSKNKFSSNACNE